MMLTPEQLAELRRLSGGRGFVSTAHMRNALAHIDAQQGRIAELEKKHLAERHAYLQERAKCEQLLAALKSAKHMLERDYIDPDKMKVVEKCDAAIEAVKGGA